MVALSVRETSPGYQAGSALPSEAVLVRLWAGQRFPADALVTLAGAPVHVLHPGLRGRGAGPDFRHARIRIADGLVRIGDIELHVRATDFRAHGHHNDRRYDHVVLHVVFEDDIGADTLLSSGRRVPVVGLAPWARRRAEDLEEAVHVDHPAGLVGRIATRGRWPGKQTWPNRSTLAGASLV